jgi:hypothetical protein
MTQIKDTVQPQRVEVKLPYLTDKIYCTPVTEGMGSDIPADKYLVLEKGDKGTLIDSKIVFTPEFHIPWLRVIWDRYPGIETYECMYNMVFMNKQEAL